MFKNYNNYGNSSFWLDNNSDIDVLTGEKLSSGKDLVQLSSYKRAIANFVQIVTGQSIPVKFQSGDSYTDGKSVTIGANLKDQNFDIAVGLALHEGSHVSITDFDVLKKLMGNQALDNFPLVEEKNLVKNHYGLDDFDSKAYVRSKLKSLLNIVEDRRIDYFIFKNSPGYKGYYHAMYDNYFNAKIINKALSEGEYSNPTSWEDYLFHICNFANPQRNLKVLPALQEVWDIMDLKNISRLGDTMSAFVIASKIFEVVELAIQKAKSKVQEPANDTDSNCPDESANAQGGGAYNTSGDPSDELDGDLDDNGESTTGEDVKPDPIDSTFPDKELETTNLSGNQKRQLDKAWSKQKDFINGKPKKQGKLSQADSNTIKALDSNGTSTINTGGTTDDLKEFAPWNQKNHKGVEVLVIKNMDNKYIQTNPFSMFLSSADYYKTRLDYNQDTVNKGLALGNQLGRKLQIRNEENTLKNTRLSKGRIDKRLLASLGFGAENVFSQEFVTKYNNAIVHLSIDISGSMSGSKFNKSQIAAIAIAKAASMTSNFDVVISYRGTVAVGNGNKPFVLIAYDSRKDKINKIKTLFKWITTCGITPEGLCFEAIADEIVSSSNGVDSYFINFSDGEPYYMQNGYCYYGKFAVHHTAKQIKAMKDRGINVLSFFINTKKRDYVAEPFKQMYGDNAANIEVNNLLKLAKELNGMFI